MSDLINKKVVLGMSGGVDSSVCAAVLKEQGYDVIGVFMKNWEDKDDDKMCNWAEDFADVRRVADQLDIPYYTINFEEEYRDFVFSYFLDEYKAGRTPNPDVMCNSEIKFKAFLRHALKMDADFIAMGHYARVEEKNGVFYLKRGKDNNKDQTYFLSRIEQNALSKAMFPIGDMEKNMVREIAHKYNLSTADKKDSTGICFIGERNFNQFLSKFLKAEMGNMIDVDSNEIKGKHTGLINYTYGQRKGIGIGGSGSGEPWFVCGKDLGENILYICQGGEHEALFSKSLIAENPFWIPGEEPKFPFTCTAKFRYRQKDIPVRIDKRDDELYVEFGHPVKAVTPGQVAVFYDGDICLGSGIIKKAEPLNSKYDYLNGNGCYRYIEDLF